MIPYMETFTRPAIVSLDPEIWKASWPRFLGPDLKIVARGATFAAWSVMVQPDESAMEAFTWVAVIS